MSDTPGGRFKTTGRVSRAQFRVVLFAVAVIAVGALWMVFTVVVQSEKSESMTVEEDVTQIEITIDSGKVELRPSATSSTSVASDQTYVLNAPSFERKTEGSTLKVKAECGSFRLGVCRSDLIVDVPSGASVSVDSKSASVQATELRNSLRIEGGSGNITTTRLIADADLSTGSGNVSMTGTSSLRVKVATESGKVDLSTATGAESVEVNTKSGDASVQSPENFGPYRVDATSSTGTATVSIRTDANAQRAITVRSASGDVKVAAAK